VVTKLHIQFRLRTLMIVCALIGVVLFGIETAATSHRSAKRRDAVAFHSRAEDKFRNWARLASKFERYESARLKNLPHVTPSDSEWQQRWNEQSVKATRLAEWHARERSTYEAEGPSQEHPNHDTGAENSPPSPQAVKY
jgi:hypothetical protein